MNNNQSTPAPAPAPSQSTSQSTPQSPPRHWHGSFGDRYEHHNVWVRGGLPQAYHPQRRHSSSASSDMSDRQGSSPSMSSTADPKAKQENTSPPTAGQRRQSGQPMLFSGLSTQKRNPLDSNMTARRESWKEQVNPGGVFSKWWDGYTKGSSK